MENIARRWKRHTRSMFHRGLIAQVNYRQGMMVPGLSSRWGLAAYGYSHGLSREEFARVRPRCRRWWAEMRTRRYGRWRWRLENPPTPVTLEQVIETMHLCQAERAEVAREVRGHPLALNRMVSTIQTFTQPNMKEPNTLLGLPIVQDPTLGRDEIRIVFGSYAQKLGVAFRDGRITIADK